MLPISQDFILDALCLASSANNADTIQLLASVLQIYRATKDKNPSAIDEEYEVFFDIIKDIVEMGVNLDKKAEISRIILKIKKSSIGKRDENFVNQVAAILEHSDEVSDQRISNLFSKIQNWVVMSKTTDILRRMLAKCNKYDPVNDSTNDIVLSEVGEHAREITLLQDRMASTSTTIDMVDFSDPHSIAKAMSIYKNKREENVFPTGLMALNRMLGPNRGFLRGESWLLCASSHNYKSAMLMSCADWCCTRSSPTVPAGMIPCVLMISLENEVPENTMEMIRRAYVTAYRKAPPKGIADNELVAAVQQHYNKRGIRLLMYRFDEYFSFQDFVKLVSKLKHSGLCVVAAILDYVGITYIDEKAQGGKNLAQMKQENLKHFCSYTKRNDILFISGWQLGPEADMLNTSGNANVVRRYGVSCLGDCKGVKREVDGLIFMYIEKNHLGVPYLTAALNKHRDTVPPPKEDTYAAWRFVSDTLGIMDDVGTGVDSSIKDIYSDDTDDHESDGADGDTTENLFSSLDVKN